MKKILYLTAIFLCFCFYAEAQQVPQGMMYQAVARDLSGNVMADQSISLKITLYSHSDKRQVQYSETHDATTNKLGLFSLTIGAGGETKGALSRIPWSTEDIWMELAIDEKGGRNFTALSSSKLLAVPYAFHAATAGEVTGFNNDNIDRNGNSPGVPSQNWSLFGNRNSDPAKDKLGTTDCADFVLVTNNIERLRIFCTGEILIDSDLDIGENLNVGNDANVDNDLTVQQNTELNITGGNTIIHGDLDVVDGSTTTLSGDLIVDGTTDLNSDVSVNNGSATNLTGTLNVDGVTELNNTLNVTDGNATNLTGVLNVDGATDLNNTLNVDGVTELNNTLNVTNNSTTNLTGALNVDGATDLNNTLNVDGVTHLNNTFNVTGGSATNLTGTLMVDGVTDLKNDLNVTNNSPTHLTGSLQVDGTTGLNGDLNLVGPLNVDGVTTLNNTLNVTNNSPTNLSGTVNVDGATTLNSSLDVTNNSPSNLTGTLNVGGATDLNGTLKVTGASILNSTFTVAGNSTTFLTGPTIIQNTLSVSENFLAKKCFQVGELSKVRLKFNPDVINTNESSFGNYPLQLSGSGAAQGMAIEVNSWHADKNFIAFFARGETGALEMRGRIENKNNFLFNTLSSKSNELMDYDPEEAIGTPTQGGDSLSQNAVANVNNADTEVSTNGITVAEANTEEIIELIILAVDLIGSVVSFATSFTSILDPLDIFEAGIALIVSTASLAAFIGFGVANVGVAYESGSGDYAEWLQKDNIEEVMNFGDIVGVTGGKISKDCADASKFMVISAAPAVIGNMPQADEEDAFETVAFMGQIPVKVRGDVYIGDYILPSGDNDGLAIAVSPEKMRAKDYGRIVGIAWEDSKIEDRNKLFQMINTAVGINQNDMANMVDQMQLVMNQMQAAIKETNPGYEGFVFDTNAKEVNLGTNYSVSSTHSSNMQGYFDGKEYGNREELGLLVRDAIVEQTGIDLSEYPMVNRMLLDPAYAESAKVHYSNLMEEYLVLLEQKKGK